MTTHRGRTAPLAMTLASLGLLGASPACSKSKAQPDATLSGDAQVDASAVDSNVPDAYVPTCTPNTGTTIAVVPFITSGLVKPLMITGAKGDRRQFVIEQAGRVRVIKDGALVTEPMLDLEPLVNSVGTEQGLLGIAFHPNWLANGLFYLAHTGANGDHVFVEYHVPQGSDVADPNSRRELLRFPDPFSNHNGGMLEFGNDGYLYIAIGDGGSGGDPGNRAQNDAAMFGKLLRIDVDTRTGSKQYGIPPTNPFATSADGPTDPRPEVWHKGLRNPFRFSFDRMTGDLYIGDVGQGGNGFPNPNLEEIDVAANAAGINWGWPDREANRCFKPTTGCATAGRTEPVIVRGGNVGWVSIIGGQVYRGTCYPNLVGKYFYGEYATGQLYTFTWNGTTATGDVQAVAGSIGNITAIHDDGLGQLYVVRHGGQIGRIVTQ